MTTQKRVLIIEDDPDYQLLIKKRLEANGFACSCFSSVETALHELAHLQPDIILLDLILEKFDGTAFLKHASEWTPDKVPPVIVMSGHNEKEIVDYCLDNGAKGFLSKPVDPKELVITVRELSEQ